MIALYNTLSRNKRPLVPLTPGMIRLYCCGMTVYDYCHIGHARSLVVFDMVVRYFRFRGYDVEYVRNITDIDDKIIKRAHELGLDWRDLTEQFIKAMHEDEQALGLIAPSIEPRATDYISEIIDLIELIISKGHAYVATNGDVYFDVQRFSEYGALSGRDIEKLIAGARIEIQQAKNSPLDFVLWKQAKPDEPFWPSPWGEGRPGWHIECSAMSTHLLGHSFDIHGGGMDLKFPHHENEIAQSNAAYGCEHQNFAQIWMHVGLLKINGEKMSKSLNNFFTIREVLEEYSAESIRYFMFSAHYRSPVDYRPETMRQIENSLARLYTALRGLPDCVVGQSHALQQRFIDSMDDDFNTPEALSILFEMAHEIQRLRKMKQMDQAAQLGAQMKAMAALLGLLQQDPEAFLQAGVDSQEVVEIQALIAERDTARGEKNWSEADRIRDVLLAQGVVLEDVDGRTIWRKDTDFVEQES